MKTQHKLLLTLLALSITACGPDDKDSFYKGKESAKYSKKEVHDNYLACYALDPWTKKECTRKLAKEYIIKDRQHDVKYVQAFQFEAEKWGFKWFINMQNLPCESIEDGPVFVKERQAYLVTCKPYGQYLMRFDYIANKWSLISTDQF